MALNGLDSKHFYNAVWRNELCKPPVVIFYELNVSGEASVHQSCSPWKKIILRLDHFKVCSSNFAARKWMSPRERLIKDFSPFKLIWNRWNRKWLGTSVIASFIICFFIEDQQGKRDDRHKPKKDHTSLGTCKTQ